MTPKEAATKKLEICSAYFNRCKDTGVTFKKRHLSRLTKEVDHNIRLSLDGLNIMEQLNTVFKYNYEFAVRINVDNTALEFHNPLQELIFDTVIFGSSIRKIK